MIVNTHRLRVRFAVALPASTNGNDGPHRLIDPARLDGEIPSGLLGAKEPILARAAGGCVVVGGPCIPRTDPQALDPANGFPKLAIASARRPPTPQRAVPQIGRASCRERG